MATRPDDLIGVEDLRLLLTDMEELFAPEVLANMNPYTLEALRGPAVTLYRNHANMLYETQVDEFDARFGDVPEVTLGSPEQPVGGREFRRI